MKALGYLPNSELANNVIEVMTVDNNATLDFTEFVTAVELLKEANGMYGELR